MRQVSIYDRADGKVKFWSIPDALDNKIFDVVKNEPFRDTKIVEIKRVGQDYEVKLKLSLFEKIKRWAKKLLRKEGVTYGIKR